MNDNINKALQFTILLAVALAMGYFVSTAKWFILAGTAGLILLLYGGIIKPWYGVVTLLLVAPFYGFLRFVIGLSNQQIILKEAMVVLLTASTLAGKVVLEKKQLHWYRHDQLLGIFLFIVLIQFFHSPDPMLGMLGLRILVTYIPLYLVIRYLKPTTAQIKMVMLFLFVIICLTTIYGLWQSAVGKTRLNELGLDKVATSMGVESANLEVIRAFSTFAGPEYFGATLILTILLLISLWITLSTKLIKVLIIAAIMMMVLALGLTLVRIEWGMLVLGIILLGIFTKKYMVIIAVIILSTIAISVAPEEIMERAKMSFGREDMSYTARQEVYTEWNVVNIGENIIGTGLGTTNGASIYAKFNKRGFASNLIGGGVTESWYTAIAIELGLMGLIIYIWLLVAIMKHCYNIYKKAKLEYLKGLSLGFLTFTASMAVANLVAPMPACFPAGDLYFWVLLGIITIMYEREQETLESESP